MRTGKPEFSNCEAKLIDGTPVSVAFCLYSSHGEYFVEGGVFTTEKRLALFNLSTAFSVNSALNHYFGSHTIKQILERVAVKPFFTFGEYGAMLNDTYYSEPIEIQYAIQK